MAIRAEIVASARRLRATAASTSLDAYRAEIDRLDATLRELSVDDAERVTQNGLTIRELVLHLGVAERTFAAELVRSREASWDDALMRRITAAELETARGVDLVEAIESWRAAAAAVIELASHADHAVAGWSIGDMLVIRAFETWTHHDDIRLAIGADESVPAREVVQNMVAFSARLAPWALAAHGSTRREATAALHLTGAVEGTWVIALEPAGAASTPPVAELTLDAVDWCKRFADRRGADVEHRVAGDVSIGRDLLVAAPAFAGL